MEKNEENTAYTHSQQFSLVMSFKISLKMRLHWMNNENKPIKNVQKTFWKLFCYAHTHTHESQVDGKIEFLKHIQAFDYTIIYSFWIRKRNNTTARFVASFQNVYLFCSDFFFLCFVRVCLCLSKRTILQCFKCWTARYGNSCNKNFKRIEAVKWNHRRYKHSHRISTQRNERKKNFREIFKCHKMTVKFCCLSVNLLFYVYFSDVANVTITTILYF